jgi:hypothetical protein
MIQYPLISIAGIYLTEDGTSTGTKYVSSVDGLDQFFTTYARNIILAIDGTPYVQRLAVRGASIAINVPTMVNTDFETIRAALDAADTAGQTVTVNITPPDSSRSYRLTCYLAAIEQRGIYLDTKKKDCTFRFTVSTTGYVLTANAGTLTLTGQSATLTQA